MVAATNALAHRIIETRTFGIAGTFPQRVNFLDELLSFRSSIDMGIGTKVNTAVILYDRRNDELRIFFVCHF